MEPSLPGLELAIYTRLAWNVQIRLPYLPHTGNKEMLFRGPMDACGCSPQASSLHGTSPNPSAREGYALCHPEHTGSQARLQEHNGL